MQSSNKSHFLEALVLDDDSRSYAESKRLITGDVILPGGIQKCDMYWLQICKYDLL